METNNSPVQSMSDTGDGRRLIAQSMGVTDPAGEIAKKNPTLAQYEYKGDPNEVAPLPPEDATGPEAGASGTVIFAGFIAQEEYNAKLQGRQGLLKFDEMRKSDATVRWSLQVVKLPIRSAEYRVQPASDSDRDKEIAEFIEWNLFERLPWTTTLRELATFLDFGFFVGEKSYSCETYQPKPIKKPAKKKTAPEPQIVNGIIMPPPEEDDEEELEVEVPPARDMIVLKAIANRKQTTIWRWEIGGGEPGVTQVTAQGTFEIPENRLMVLTNEREGNNYYGVSLLRSAYKHWYMKDAMYKISAVAAERQGVGIIKIKQLAKPSGPERAQAVAAAENIRANEMGYVEEPAGFDMNFMDMNSHGTMNLAADIEHHDRQIMKNVGAAFMEMGATRSSGSTGGSRSASNDQSEVYELAVEAVANEIEEAINTQVIRQLVDLNYSGVTRYPTLRHNKIGQHDLATYATAISAMVNADVITPDPDLEQALRDRADLPDLPDKIRNNYDKRDRAQSSQVPQFAPIAAPGTSPAPGKPVDGITPPNKPLAPAGTKQPDPATVKHKPNDVKASELVESVKKFYSTTGELLETIAQED